MKQLSETEWACEYGQLEFSHAGDMGDVIWGTAALRLWAERNYVPCVDLHLYHRPGRTTHAMTAERAALLLPLLNAQSWLHAKHFAAGELRSDFDGFRDHMRSAPCIAGAHLSAIGCQLNGGHAEAVQRAWLTVPQATPLPEGRRVVFVRSHRYKSHDFPWTDLVDWFGDLAVFMGLPGEWQTFCKDHPRAVDRVLYLPTGDLLEAAQYIAAADFCVSNQTSLFGVMEGLKKPRVLESFSPLRNCEYGSRSCLAVHPGDRVTPDRIIELMGAPHTV